MGYVYSALWFIVAVVLLVRYRKENIIVYFLSAYFFIMGMWWLADQFLEVDLMKGTYAWILRGISLVMLIIILIAYYFSKHKSTQSSDKD